MHSVDGRNAISSRGPVRTGPTHHRHKVARPGVVTSAAIPFALPPSLGRSRTGEITSHFAQMAPRVQGRVTD